jgi:hypothetical protein
VVGDRMTPSEGMGLLVHTRQLTSTTSQNLWIHDVAECPNRSRFILRGINHRDVAYSYGGITIETLCMT